MDAFAIPIEQAIEEHVPAEHRDSVRARWHAEQIVTFRAPNELSATGGPRAWFESWDPAVGYHWLRLRHYLIDRKGRSEGEVESLDDSSDAVLRHLEDPRGDAPFRVQGLVLGYVQSGKTANFTALISKAADVGYKFVIVLSGIHNSLRQQTQERLDRELGLVPDLEGVGLPEPGERWVTLTENGLHGDFRAGTFGAAVLQGNARAIAVVKKNASVLTRLVNWLEGHVPPSLPVLIIDDEADQASINTRGNRSPREIADLDEDDLGGVPLEDELDPSRINGLIRDLVGKFRRVSYVGYTATPFANVLIDPEAVDRQFGHDLYPRDFIINLPRPPAYVGAEALFGRSALDGDADGMDGIGVVRVVPDHEIGSLIPPSRNAVDFEPDVTPTLRTAIVDFVLATSAKGDRLGPGIATMLIHTTQRIATQIRLGDAIEAEVRELRRSWRYDNQAVRPEFVERWENDFRPLTQSIDIARDRPFSAIEEQVRLLFRDGIDVLVLNSESLDVLDFDSSPTLKAILVGGNRLSRGLTIEDLMTSYFVRNSTTYDTLLQMGRWFGYRNDYIDLTRLWTTQDLYANFRHLALVEEELRRQIAVYERERLTPLDFGPRIRKHQSMLVTAKNKMGAGDDVKVSFAGELLQTVRFHLDDKPWLTANLNAARGFLGALGSPSAMNEPDGRIGWRDVSWEEIIAFLREYRTVPTAQSMDAGLIVKYIRAQATEQGELVRWRVSLRHALDLDKALGTEPLGVTGHGAVNCIARSRLKADRMSIGALVTTSSAAAPRRGDEVVGYSDAQIEAAQEDLVEWRLPTFGHALRRQRDPREGLLMVFPISAKSPVGKNAINRVPLFDDPAKGETVVGIAVSFPHSESAATVEYVAGPTGRPEELDDDDLL